MRVKRIAARAALGIVAGAAMLAISSPAQALPPGELYGYYSTLASCQAAGQAEVAANPNIWEDYICPHWGVNLYALYLQKQPF